MVNFVNGKTESKTQTRDMEVNTNPAFICSTCGEHIGITTTDCRNHDCMSGLETIWIVDNMVYPHEPVDNGDDPEESSGMMFEDETQETSAKSIDSEVEEVSQQPAAELWPKQAKQLVIKLYPKYLSLFTNRAILSKEKMFAKIAEEMQKFGYTYSGEQVKNRWRCFEKSYKTYTQHNTLRGRGHGRKTLEFSQELHDIFQKESRFYPEVVTSRDKTVMKPAVAISLSTMPERILCSESATLGNTKINHGGASSSSVTVDADCPSFANKKMKYTYKATSTVLEGIRIEMKRRNDIKEKQVEVQKKRNELLEKKLVLLEKHLINSN